MSIHRVKPGQKIKIDIEDDAPQSSAGESKPSFIGVEPTEEQLYVFKKGGFTLHDLGTRTVDGTGVNVSLPFTVDSFSGFVASFRAQYLAQMLTPGMSTAVKLPVDLEKLFVDLSFFKFDNDPEDPEPNYIVLAGHKDMRPLLQNIRLDPSHPLTENQHETDWSGQRLVFKKAGQWSVQVESVFYNAFDTGSEAYKVTATPDPDAAQVEQFSVSAKDAVKILLTPRYLQVRDSFEEELPYHFFRFPFALPDFEPSWAVETVTAQHADRVRWFVSLAAPQWAALLAYIAGVPAYAGEGVFVETFGFAGNLPPFLAGVILKNNETLYVWRVVAVDTTDDGDVVHVRPA